MTNQILTSTKNPLIKKVRKLHRSKERKKQNLLLLEGNNMINSAIGIGLPLVTIFCTPKWQERHQQLMQSLVDAKKSIQLVSPEVLAAIATTVNPDGIVAVAERKFINGYHESSCDLILGLAVERLQDPGNLGTIIRTAVATGVEHLWLSQDSVDLDNPKVLRASVGEWFRLPMTTVPNLGEIVREQKQNGIQIIATVPQSTTSYWELDLTCPSLLLIGNEGQGISPELAALADKEVSIPLAKDVESLNAAVATAVILYEVRRQMAQLSQT